MKKILSFALAAIMLVTMSIVPSAHPSDYNCSYDANTKTLTINEVNITKDIVEDLSQYYDFENVIIGEKTEIISKESFYGRDSLKSVTIGKDVQSIGDKAFAECYSLKEVNFNAIDCAVSDDAFALYCTKDKIDTGDKVQDCINMLYPLGTLNIGEDVEIYSEQFTCTNFTEVNINSTEAIGYRAFYNCMLLEKVTIGKDVQSIGDKAFAECYSLKEVNFNAVDCAVSDDAFALYYTKDKIDTGDEVQDHINMFYPLGTLNIGENVVIYPELFDNTHFTEINIADSIEVIGTQSFYGCILLKKVTFGKDVQYIGDEAFADCYSLNAVIYNGTYEEWQEIQIGEGNDVLYENLFVDIHPSDYNCSYDANTKTLTINEVKITQNIISDISEHYDFENVIIGKNVTIIDEFAFEYCNSLKTVVVPSNVTKIERRAFYGCDNLDTVTIKEGVTNIGRSAFGSCDSLTTITIPNSVTSIGHSAFWYCKNLKTVIIGNGVTNIYDDTFADCNSLTSFIVDENNIEYSSDECGVLYNKDKTNLIQYPAGNSRKTFVIPDSVESIGDYAFKECESLTSVTIPDSVTSIGNDVFSGCINLASLIVPDSVISIGYYAFTGCRGLISVTIGNSVTIIDERAFIHCDNLTSIIIPKSVTYIGNGAFDDCNNLNVVHYTGNESQWKDLMNNCFGCGLENIEVNYIKNNYTYDETAQTLTINDEIVAKDIFDELSKINVQLPHVKKVVIGENATSIESGAFSALSNLEEVDFYAENCTIAKNAFNLNCPIKLNILGNASIKSQTFKNADANIEKIYIDTTGYVYASAFMGTSALKEVEIINAKGIYAYAFAECPNIEKVVVKSSGAVYANSFELTEDKALGTLEFYPNGAAKTFNNTNFKNVIISGEKNESLSSNSFTDCKYLESVVIRNNVKTIYNGSFANCPSLKDVFYFGTSEDWAKVKNSNKLFTNAFVVCEDEIITPIRGSVSLNENKFTIKIADGKTATGFYKQPNSSAIASIELHVNNGNVLDREDSYVAYTSSNNKNPEGVLTVTFVNGDVKLYNIELNLGCIDIAAELKPIRGSVEIKDDIVLITMTPGKNATGIYATTNSGHTITFENIEGSFDKRTDAFVAYTTSNRANVKGTMIVTLPDGKTFKYKTIFDIGLGEGSFEPELDIRPIRGSVELNDDGAIIINMASGKDATGFYTTTKNGYKLELKDAKGIFADRKDAYVAYASKNYYNPEATLVVTAPDGTTTEYPVIFEVGLGNIGSIQKYDPATDLRAIRSNITRNTDGTIVITRLDSLTKSQGNGIYATTKSGATVTIKEAGTFANRTDAYVAYLSQNDKNIESTMIITFPDGLTETYPVLFDLGYTTSSSEDAKSATILVKIWGEGEDNDADNVVISVDKGTRVDEDKLEELLMKTYGYDVMADAFDVTVEAGNTYMAQVINIGDPIEKNIEVQLCNTTNGCYENLYYAQGELISNETIVEKLSEMCPNADWTQLTINGTINEIAAPNCTYSVSVTVPPMSFGK